MLKWYTNGESGTKSTFPDLVYIKFTYSIYRDLYHNTVPLLFNSFKFNAETLQFYFKETLDTSVAPELSTVFHEVQQQWHDCHLKTQFF